MTKSTTVRLDEKILRKARDEAAQQNQSLSEWLGELILEAVSQRTRRQTVKQNTLKVLDRTFDLGGRALTRDEIYAERLR